MLQWLTTIPNQNPKSEQTQTNPIKADFYGKKTGNTLQKNKKMRNEPNFNKDTPTLTHEITKDYNKSSRRDYPKNEPKANPIRTQYEANSKPICGTYFVEKPVLQELTAYHHKKKAHWALILIKLEKTWKLLDESNSLLYSTLCKKKIFSCMFTLAFSVFCGKLVNCNTQQAFFG